VLTVAWAYAKSPAAQWRTTGPTPEFERERLVGSVGHVSKFDQARRARVPRLSVRERLMEEAAMEKVLLLIAILSIILVASKLSRTIPAARS
jgi:hypothetical protein